MFYLNLRFFCFLTVFGLHVIHSIHSISFANTRKRGSRISNLPVQDSAFPKKHIHLPYKRGKVCYEYISPMDSSLSKERIYRAALNWYFKTFPYGRSNLLEYDLVKGRILARGEFTFSYTIFWDECLMKVHYTMDCSIQYGKFRMQFYEIEPQDQVMEEGNYGKMYRRFEPRDLTLMYEQYLAMDHPSGFAQEKIEGIDSYFKKELKLFSKQMETWTKSKPYNRF